MRVLSIKVSIRKKSGNLFNGPRTSADSECSLVDLLRIIEDRDGWWESCGTPCYEYDLMMVIRDILTRKQNTFITLLSKDKMKFTKLSNELIESIIIYRFYTCKNSSNLHFLRVYIYSYACVCVWITIIMEREGRERDTMIREKTNEEMNAE